MKKRNQLRVALVLVANQIELVLRVIALCVQALHVREEGVRNQPATQQLIDLQTLLQQTRRTHLIDHNPLHHRYKQRQFGGVAITQRGIAFLTHQPQHVGKVAIQYRSVFLFISWEESNYFFRL